MPILFYRNYNKTAFNAGIMRLASLKYWIFSLNKCFFFPIIKRRKIIELKWQLAYFIVKTQSKATNQGVQLVVDDD
jgi:hypothetical protein